MKKTIKIYTFFRNVAALVLLSLLLISPAFAAGASTAAQKASSASVSPCFPSPVSSMDKAAPRKGTLPQAQRSAGSPSAAMMLAMALGLRNISGPVEHVQHIRPSPSVRQAALPSGVKCTIGQSAGQTRVAMER
ncbi:MAG TPA: hypothetical protein VFS88_08995 [Micavibrio sp.]|nr:hypothetical protein [Micavibrio sp.]